MSSRLRLIKIPNNASFKSSKGKGGRRDGCLGPSKAIRLELDEEDKFYFPKSPKELKEFEVRAEQREETREDISSEDKLHIIGCTRRSRVFSHP